MRVSKTVREYIEKQVNAKLEHKYAPAIAAEKEQDEICSKINDEVRDKIARLIFNEAQTAINAHDFLSPMCGDNYESVRRGLGFSVGRIVAVERKTGGARTHMSKEAKEIVQNIIVELELGGTKADLERLLAEIEVEV